MRVAPADPARQVLALAGARPPTLGDARLICLDGFSGAGKSTLAAALAELGGAAVLHVDDMVDGWGGLPTVSSVIEPVLRTLSRGESAWQPRYHFSTEEYGDPVLVHPAPLVVLEGVGSGQQTWADLITVLVWLDCDQATGLERAVARDGESIREPMRTWQRDERKLLAREQTDARADLRWRT